MREGEPARRPLNEGEENARPPLQTLGSREALALGRTTLAVTTAA